MQRLLAIAASMTFAEGIKRYNTRGDPFELSPDESDALWFNQ